jgi:hypothetical protein
LGVNPQVSTSHAGERVVMLKKDPQSLNAATRGIHAGKLMLLAITGKQRHPPTRRPSRNSQHAGGVRGVLREDRAKWARIIKQANVPRD